MATAAAAASAGTTAEGMSAVLEPIRAKHDLPALAAAVIVNGKTAAAGAVGVRKYGDATPVTVGDRFHLGSCTKAMTATLIGMLVEQGKLKWDMALPDALPSLEQGMNEEARRVTVDHLLAHRSGLQTLHPARPVRSALEAAWRHPARAREQRRAFVEFLLKQKPASVPGASYVYSNAGYIILGAIVEEVTGEPWEDVIRKRLFRPLRMGTAGFGPMGTPGKLDQPCQHTLRDGKHTVIEPGPYSDNPPALGPAGLCHCSVGDWAKFLIAVVTGESPGNRLLRRETWKRLLTPQFSGEYAGGWLITQRNWGGRVLTHAGSNTMNFAVAWLAPDKRFGVAVMTNCGGDDAAGACDEAASAVIGGWKPG